MTTKQKWEIISKCERAILIDGRRFFAARCPNSPKRQVEELNQPQINGSRSLGVVLQDLTTRELTAYFKRNPLPPQQG